MIRPGETRYARSAGGAAVSWQARSFRLLTLHQGYASTCLILSPYDWTVLDSVAMCANLPGIDRISLVLRENEQRFEWTWERPRRRRSKRAA